MEDDLPTEYDVIVVGTGMTESIVAAAASRIGKKVLHLDSNEYYGGLWATFNFDGFQKWIEDLKTNKSDSRDSDPKVESGESFLKASNQYSTVENIEENWYIVDDADLPEVSSKDTQTEGAGDAPPEGAEKSDEDKVEKKELVKHWSTDRIKKEYRKFNIDLAPKLLYARGELVELLISSNIARYAEFRAVSRVTTFMDGKLVQVPCSRADVFANKTVSVIEKRMLMQLLSSCMDQGADSPEFDGLTESLRTGIGRWSQFDNCHGFLSGFFRRTIKQSKILLFPEHDRSVGDENSTRNLLIAGRGDNFWWQVALTDDQVLESESLLPVMLHMTCKRTKTAKEDLEFVVKKFLKVGALEPNISRSPTDSHTQTVSPDKRHLTEGEQAAKDIEDLKPHTMWSLYLNLPASDIKLSNSAPSNVHLCSGPDLDLDFDFAVNQAKEIFKSMYPDEDFLPRAPDPEEIVLEGEEAPGPKFEGDQTAGEGDEKQDVEKAEKEE
ncbi:rab proteins geranylgeranyltransferase component A 2 [Belonocnema kinseyi]|uniref:rab proteins geranylgeranyltransferase component A 2 n=1 Tax=Belonocnema kinseyi TaxID=2817044 RepID=UPI00143D8F56|nr:rab proteins geranylgeranyltransferase component A 2 [Belonocnema kinseyi]